MGKIAPSILSADFTRLGQEIEEVEKAGADYIHIDVMDGHFVPNITIGPMIVKAIRRVTDLPLDVHLMISDPDSFIDEFAEAGSSIITVHAETISHMHGTIQHIRDKGAKSSVSLNPATPLQILEYILADLDMVLLMTVNPGFGGQEFIPEVVPKIIRLREMIDKKGLDIEIEVDGGIGIKTAPEVIAAGADILVAGSAFYKSGDYRVFTEKIKGL